MNNGKKSKNYYIWLDLPVDKPVRDVSRLLKKLDDKANCWRGDVGPDRMIYQRRHSKYADIKDMLRTSLDSLIQGAKDEVRKEFENCIKTLVDSVGYITPESLEKQVLPTVSPQWSESTVRAELEARHILIVEHDRDLIPQKPNDYVQVRVAALRDDIRLIKERLAMWHDCGGTDKEFENLYAFLGLPIDADIKILMKRKDDETGVKKQLGLGNIDQRTVLGDLAGLCSKIFRDNESRRRYDVALKLEAADFWNRTSPRLRTQPDQGDLMELNDYWRTVAELFKAGLPIDHAKWLVHDYVVNEKKGQIGSSMSKEDQAILDAAKSEEGKRKAQEAKNKADAEALRLKEQAAQLEKDERERKAKEAQQEEKAFIDLKSPVVRFEAVSEGISLSWDPVIGADGYYIIRQTGRPPINDTDTDGTTKRLKAGDGECWTDNNNLMFGRSYHYIVYPCRGGRHGKNGIAILKGTPTPPILWMQPVTGLEGDGFDDQITLRWTLPKISSPYSVKLIRRHDGREINIDLNESEYSGPYIDKKDVTKGGSYSYRVVVTVDGKDVVSKETEPIIAETKAITDDVTNREFVRRGRSIFVSWSWVPEVDKVIVSHTDKPQGKNLFWSSLDEGRDYDIYKLSDNPRDVEVKLKGSQTFIGVYPFNGKVASSAEPDRVFLAEPKRIAITTKRSWLGRCEGLIFAGLQKGTNGRWLPEFVINARVVKNYTVEEIGSSSEIDANGLFKVPDQYRKGYEFTFECKSKTDNSNYSFEKR